MAKFRVEVTETSVASFIIDAESAEQAREIYSTISADYDYDDLINREMERGYEGREITAITMATSDDLLWFPELDNGEDRNMQVQ